MIEKWFEDFTLMVKQVIPDGVGGETTLYSRQIKIFSPVGISWKNTAGIVSPTKAQLEAGANWTLANSNDSKAAKYFPIKAIPIARVISRG